MDKTTFMANKTENVVAMTPLRRLLIASSLHPVYYKDETIIYV